jgi:hypothetical protein
VRPIYKLVELVLGRYIEHNCRTKRSKVNGNHEVWHHSGHYVPQDPQRTKIDGYSQVFFQMGIADRVSLCKMSAGVFSVCCSCA